jgi:hypothetical protein
MIITHDLEDFVKILAIKWHNETGIWPKDGTKYLADELYKFWNDAYNIKEMEVKNEESVSFKGTQLYLTRNRLYHLFMAYGE